MCAKVAQNHETKEQKAKNPSIVLLSRIFYVPLPPTMSHSCVPSVASERSSSGNRLVALSREFFAERSDQRSSALISKT